MKINNKYTVWDIVYFMLDNKITYSKIFQITIYVKNNYVDIMYYLEISRDQYHYENAIFKSKEELINTL